MELAITGGAQAFEVILDRHSGPALLLAFGMCGQRAAAEDEVPEAIGAFHRSDTGEGQPINDEGLAERPESGKRTKFKAAEYRAQSRVIQEALDAVPADQRQVIELAYLVPARTPR